MDPCKAMELHCIDGKLFRMASLGISCSSISTYNFSLMSHQLARESKYDRVTPIFKRRLLEVINSYCPVSTLSKLYMRIS